MKWLASLIFILLLWPLTATAEIPTAIKTDFAPLTGYIVMPVGDEFLIDLDAADNLREGDILTLIMPGEKVIHPISKKVLGTLDMPKGFLQVTRIKSGYSYAKLLYAETPPKKGDKLKRFEQVPTVFHADPADSKLYQDLKAGLPQLDWLDENSQTAPLLTFTLKKNLLTVQNSSGMTLGSYQKIDGELQANQTRQTAASTFAAPSEPSASRSPLNKMVNNLMDSVGLGISKDPIGPPGIIYNQEALKKQGIWMGPALAGNPVGIAVADLDNDGQLETAVAMETELLITWISQQQQQEEARVELPAGTKLLSLDAIDLDRNGVAELYLTAAKDQELKSMVIEYNGSDYQKTITDIPWFLRTMEYPGSGRILVGQRTKDEDHPFFGSPFKVVRTGDQLSAGEELSLPDHSNLFSIQPLPGTDATKPLFAYLSQGDYLKVASSENELWESADYFGGTETLYYNTRQNDKNLPNPTYIQQRILPSPDGGILVAQNDGIRTLDRFRRFKNSRIIDLQWDGFSMRESWRTSGLNGYLADFAFADADNDGEDELVLIEKFKHESVVSEGRSSIVIYEMK